MKSVSFLQTAKHQQGVLNSDKRAACFNDFILWRFSFLMNFFMLTSGILFLDQCFEWNCPAVTIFHRKDNFYLVSQSTTDVCKLMIELEQKLHPFNLAK